MKEENGDDIVFTCSYDTVTPSVNKVELYIDNKMVNSTDVSVFISFFI